MALTRRGFTLVELILAATMVAILMVGLGTHLRGAVTVWRRTTDTVDALQRERVALERLSQDLASAFVYDGSEHAPIEHTFDSDRARWFTLVSSTKLGAGPETAVRFVTYQCGAADGRFGLVRTEQTAHDARMGTTEAAEQILLPDCRALMFRYGYLPEEGAGELVWREQWPYPKELPRLIEVTLTRASGRTIHAVFTNPAGSLCLSGAAPQCRAAS